MPNLTNEELQEVLLKIQQDIIDNIGTGESEKVQEKNSTLEIKGLQEQLKKDYAWIKQQIEDSKEEDNTYTLGNYRDRIFRKRRIDYDIS